MRSSFIITIKNNNKTKAFGGTLRVKLTDLELKNAHCMILQLSRLFVLFSLNVKYHKMPLCIDVPLAKLKCNTWKFKIENKSEGVYDQLKNTLAFHITLRWTFLERIVILHKYAVQSTLI